MDQYMAAVSASISTSGQRGRTGFGQGEPLFDPIVSDLRAVAPLFAAIVVSAATGRISKCPTLEEQRKIRASIIQTGAAQRVQSQRTMQALASFLTSVVKAGGVTNSQLSDFVAIGLTVSAKTYTNAEKKGTRAAHKLVGSLRSMIAIDNTQTTRVEGFKVVMDINTMVSGILHNVDAGPRSTAPSWLDTNALQAKTDDELLAMYVPSNEPGRGHTSGMTYPSGYLLASADPSAGTHERAQQVGFSEAELLKYHQAAFIGECFDEYVKSTYADITGIRPRGGRHGKGDTVYEGSIQVSTAAHKQTTKAGEI